MIDLVVLVLHMVTGQPVTIMLDVDMFDSSSPSLWEHRDAIVRIGTHEWSTPVIRRGLPAPSPLDDIHATLSPYPTGFRIVTCDGHEYDLASQPLTLTMVWDPKDHCIRVPSAR